MLQLKFILVILICFVSNKSIAQSLIAGIPSADIAPFKKLMFTHESQLNTWKYNKPKWNSFNFLCYGVAKNTELSITFSNLSNQAISHECLGIGFKRIIDINVFSIPEAKFIFGQNVLFSVDEPTVGGWTYAMLSARVPKLKTRLTSGLSYGSAELFGYDSVQVKQGNEVFKFIKRRNPLSIMVGLEQPIIDKKFAIIADWFSGTHDLAALIAGTQFEFHKLILITGYKFPNFESTRNGSVIVEVMYEF